MTTRDSTTTEDDEFEKALRAAVYVMKRDLFENGVWAQIPGKTFSEAIAAALLVARWGIDTTIEERVARAICSASGDDPDQLWNVQSPEPRWRLFIDEARAAIAIMQEETNNA